MADYFLKWCDKEVLTFNTYNETLKLLNPQYLPFGISNMEPSYQMIVKFCSDRILLGGRKHYGTILRVCKMERKTPLEICIQCNGLSVIDNFWICGVSDKRKWLDVCLFRNEFSDYTACTALSGVIDTLRTGECLPTGELTLKGTKAKCIERWNNKLCLFKEESYDEIDAEILAKMVADAVGIKCTKYINATIKSYRGSLCELGTGTHTELIPFRDILTYTKNGYGYVRSLYEKEFCRMQIFDFLTLNTDRNRDNFGLLSRDGTIVSMFPLFDHDSCFSGRSVNGIYFPSGMTFRDTLESIKKWDSYGGIDINGIRKAITCKDFAKVFNDYGHHKWYVRLVERLEYL